MKINYPIGVQTFETIRNRNYIYVDKTDLVYNLAQKHICFLCRPRRFGKSLTLSTLDAYFHGRKDLFTGLKIMDMESEWKEHAVFSIDFNNTSYQTEGALSEKIESKLSEWEKVYGKKEMGSLGERFEFVLEQAHLKTGRGAVVLIDEYDKPLLDVIEPSRHDENNILAKNRETLKAFYSVFKSADEHLRFVMLTGITKFAQISVFSGFNQPEDITLMNDFEALCGITKDELTEYFAEPIHEMAEKYQCSDSEMISILQKQYDGYHFSHKMTDVFNPFSIINAFNAKCIDNYWFRSGTPTFLARLVSGAKINMDEILANDYKPEYFIDYKADTAMPLPMIFQSGYLTIKAYNLHRNTYKLGYPNKEVEEGFVALLANDYMKTGNIVSNTILKICDMLEEGRTDDMRKNLTAFLSSIPYDATIQNSERHFQYTLYLIFRLLSCYLTVKAEDRQSEGRVDCIVETDKHVYIFEFKRDNSATSALQQIEEKGYARPYKDDKRKLHKIGINFSSKTRTIEEWLEA